MGKEFKVSDIIRQPKTKTLTKAMQKGEFLYAKALKGNLLEKSSEKLEKYFLALTAIMDEAGIVGFYSESQNLPYKATLACRLKPTWVATAIGLKISAAHTGFFRNIANANKMRTLLKGMMAYELKGRGKKPYKQELDVIELLCKAGMGRFIDDMPDGCDEACEYFLHKIDLDFLVARKNGFFIPSEKNRNVTKQVDRIYSAYNG